MTESPQGQAEHKPSGPGMVTVVLGSLVIFVIGCALVIAFAIR